MLTHISLFSGMGCESIAAEWAGFQTILMCEIDADCRKVLNKHWPSVPIIEDVRNVTRESVIANTESLQNDQRDGGSMAEAATVRESSNTATGVGNQSSTDTLNDLGQSGGTRQNKRGMAD